MALREPVTGVIFEDRACRTIGALLALVPEVVFSIESLDAHVQDIEHMLSRIHIKRFSSDFDAVYQDMNRVKQALSIIVDNYDH